MSYEHLADVFSRAIVDTRSIPAALEIVDAYRIRGAGVELAGGLPTLALRVAAQLFGVPAGRILSRETYLSAMAMRSATPALSQWVS